MSWINNFFRARPKLTQALMWIFVLNTFAVAFYLCMVYPDLGIGEFVLYLIIPAALAIYFRGVSGTGGRRR